MESRSVSPSAMPSKTPRPRGRPRSERCQRAIRAAIAELLDELPYEEVTIEAVAERASVSKQTIYRWWSGKHQLAMEAYEQLLRDRIPTPDTGALKSDLQTILRTACKSLRTRGGATIAGLIAAAQSDPALAQEFRSTLIGARRKVMSELLERGLARGELRQGIDIQLAMDLLNGPVWYRLLLRNAPLDNAFADSIVDSFLRAFSRPRERTSPRE